MTFPVKKPNVPNVTEIQVRMDCNGCVHKIQKALQTVQGIYEVHEDIPHQKIIVVGWADPEKVIRAIKKAGKIPKLCSHTLGEEEGTTATAERVDATATSSSSAATVTQEPAEQNNQTVTEENAAATTDTGGEPPPPAEENPPPVDDENTQAQEISDLPPQEITCYETIQDRRELYYMDIENNRPRHGYLIRNGLDGYQVAQEYVRDAENHEYPRYNYPDYADPRYQRYLRDQYYNNNNGGSSSYGNSRATAADSNRFATMFSDENPNACCIN